ncbi:MAG: VWA domain-containing protein [Rhodocyclaceae bacterium]|nr:VWA domain-containing protein [Rhodocyclaceae bacterium]
MPSFDAASRLTFDELKARLDDIFYLDISTGRSYERLLDALVLLARPKQEFALHWGKVAARTDVEIGYLVIQLAPEALRAMAPMQAERWVIAALDAYDGQGMRAAVASLRDIAAGTRAGAALRLDGIEARLAHFVKGLSGRPLQIAAAAGGEGAWTDTATLHLPAQIEAADAIDRYKALAALLWAQMRHGSFGAGVDAALAAYGEPARAAAWLALLEAVRLAARLARDLPGLAAALAELLAAMPPQLDAARAALARPQASVADSLAWLPRLMDGAPPADAPFGPLRLQLALQVRAERIAQDKLVLRRAVAGLIAALGKPGGAETAVAVAIAPGTGELRIDGEVVALPPEGRAAAQSLIDDLGEIPPECMTPAGPSAWTPTAREGAGPTAAATAPADAVYDEWDYRRRAYRRRWCHLYWRDLPPGDAAYVADVRRRYAVPIRQIRRRFEALRGEDRVLKRQPDGTEIDLDALVAAIADRRGGADHDERLFARRSRDERSLAAMFVVDMSGSTKGWVNDAEREALVMLCEALEMLGDRYAIWGFSGWTRTRCELYRIKDFADCYDEGVERRIAAIEAKDYTRMGPPLRHLTQLLLREPAKHRLLVTLSDGRPDDFGDEYRGQYGVEDTRQALIEARRAGVRSYCVTIDRHGADYLKHMYGPASYTVLADVSKLPLRIADIYRKLTS